MRGPIQQDLLTATERTRQPRPKPRPQKRFLSDELRAHCRRIAWLYGQGREPPPDDEDDSEETETPAVDGPEGQREEQ